MAIKFDNDIDGTAFNGITGLATITPLPNGTGSVGESTAAAREDHTHPADDEKASLASPTFTGTVNGISKSMVGLGRVDDTADSAKNVFSATKLTTARTIGGVSFTGLANINLPGVNAAGNQSTTGNAATSTKLATAVNIGGVPFDGSANIPQRETTHHSASFIFAVNTKQYIGLLRADSENTVVANQFLPFLAPFSGKLLKVFVRSSSGLTTGDFTLRLEKNALNVAAGTTPTTVAEIEEDGPANSTMTTYDFTSLSSPMSNSITAGDMVFISIESDTAFSGVKIYFTCLWEWDY